MVGWNHGLNGHEFEQTPGIVKDREAWRAAAHGVTKSQTRQQLNSNNNVCLIGHRQAILVSITFKFSQI